MNDADGIKEPLNRVSDISASNRSNASCIWFYNLISLEGTLGKVKKRNTIIDIMYHSLVLNWAFIISTKRRDKGKAVNILANMNPLFTP